MVLWHQRKMSIFLRFWCGFAGMRVFEVLYIVAFSGFDFLALIVTCLFLQYFWLIDVKFDAI